MSGRNDGKKKDAKDGPRAARPKVSTQLKEVVAPTRETSVEVYL